MALSLILCASHSRTFSLINGYGAPMEVYKILEHHDDAGPGKNYYLALLGLMSFLSGIDSE